MQTNKRPSVVIPISGGMDSTVLLFKALYEFDNIHAVSFNYGQKHSKELNLALIQVEKAREKKDTNITYRVIDIPFFKEIANTSSLTNNNLQVAKAKDVMGDPQTVNYVPFRNLMLISICLAHAESHNANVVWHGAAQADSIAGYWDGSAEFINEVNRVSALNRRLKILVEAPLLNKSKTDIVTTGVHYGVDFANTWTCYEGGNEACGECTACSLRLQGFVKSGFIDPVPYRKEIDWNSLNCIPY
jgi:7-cyano-7-deazaguanine synthase